MEFLRPVRSVLAFLTILPAGDQSHDIRYVAKNMHLFPIAGLTIGAIVGCMAFGISIAGLHPLIVGLLVTGALVIITGVHHTDALADFADGLMAKGDKEVKHKAMMDPAVGSAGVAALVMYFAGTIIVFNTGLSALAIFTSIISAEVLAKYSMVFLANRGLSAWEGLSSPFTAAMKDTRKIAAATGVMLVIVWFGSSYAGFAALGVSLAMGLILRYVSGRSFGGISGDVLGASNELVRLSSLIVLTSIPVMTIS